MSQRLGTPARLLLAASLVMLTAGGTIASAGNVRITGSTTVYPLAQTAAEIFMEENSGVEITVMGTGSSDGIKSVIQGSAEIGNASRNAKQKEWDLAKSKGIQLVEHVVALDCIVPIVHPSNPVKNLTAEQLQAIYTGKVHNWSELGGKDEPILVVSRDAASGTFEVWNKLILKKAAQRGDVMIEESNSAVAEIVSSKPNALGYVGIGYLAPTIKGLSVNGIEATVETAQNSSYPVSRKLYMYTNGEPTGAVKQFLDFVTSPEGAEIAADEGFVPAMSRMAQR